MVKTRISATVDKNTEKLLKDIMKKGRYRNKSHAIEEAIRLLFEEKKK
jgi:Arc/MetJ-type ribon-helix-helix transcriptional regulator